MICGQPLWVYWAERFIQLTDIDFTNVDPLLVGQNYGLTYDPTNCKNFVMTPITGGWPLTVRVTLTPAQILALFTTPVQLIAAPWANNYIIVDKIVGALDFNTTAYVSANSLNYSYTNGAWFAIFNHLNSFLTSAANIVRTAQNEWFAHTVNAPVVAFVPVANPTLWDSPIILDITYRIVQFII